MKKRVLVLGELNVDLILNNIEGLPEIGAEKISNDLNLTLGSSSAIFSSNLSFLGAEVSFLGMIGKDQFGELVMSSLKNKEVNTDLIIRSEQHQTGVTVVLNYDMDRAMITYPGAMNHLSYDHFEEVDLSNFDHLHISSIFLQPLVRKDILKILGKAKDNKLTTSLDPQWDPSEDWDLDLIQLLPLVDVFLPNDKEFFALTKTSRIEEGIRKIDSAIDNNLVIKNGEHGATIKNKNMLKNAPAYLNSNVVDCIGAGDSFDAGFIYAFINNMPAEKCLEIGNIMGAINTTSSGGTGAFSTIEEVKTLAKEKFNFNIEI